MLIYSNEVSLAEGFEILSAERKDDRLVRGKKVSRASGWLLFNHMRGTPIRCWCCGIEADRWVVVKGRNDHHGPPVLNLYAVGLSGGVMMMTRDHIIPKSLGGVDDIENLRPGCDLCNSTRGNLMTPEDLQFAKDHPELINKSRIIYGLDGLARRLHGHRPEHKISIEEMKLPFQQMGYIE